MIKTIYSCYDLSEEEAAEVVLEIAKRLKNGTICEVARDNPFTDKKRQFYDFLIGLIHGLEVFGTFCREIRKTMCEMCPPMHNCPRIYANYLVFRTAEILEKEGGEGAKKFVLDQIRLAKTILTHQPKYII